MTTHLWRLCAIAAVALAGLLPAARATSPAHHHGPALTQAQAVAKAMRTQFDKPDAPLTVKPVSVAGRYAVAGWLQHDRGGRALLERRNGHWVIVACAGDSLTQAATLKQAGMLPAQARHLAASVSRAERALDPGYVAKLALFEGYVKIDGAGHGAQGGHDQHRGAGAAHGTPKPR